MKKILGISLVAVLAVSPMMAMAEGELGSAVTIAGTLNDTTGSAFTTQSYVKGAYNAVEGDLANVNAAVTKLNGNDQTAGSVRKEIKDKAALATYNANDEGYVEGTIGYAIKNAVSTSATSAGDGLAKSAEGVFSVKVDDTTVGLNANKQLEVKAGSIGTTQLASGVVTSLGLADTAVQPGSLATVATTGAASDITGLATVATTGAASDITTDADHRFVTDAEKTTWSGKQDELSATNQLNPAYVATDANNAFVTEAQKTAWDNAATAVADYTTDLAAKQDKSDSTVTAAQAQAHTILTEGAGVAGNLVSLAGGIEAIDGTAIPVATAWGGASGNDTTSTMTISSFRN
ncbi:MAG: hypothetical protein IKF41_03160 [Alphaproteobacteria bacterium]|nr:hypothetical protein [Alphaproteobacteria bacterium]